MTPRAGRPAGGADTRAAILTAGRKLFSAKGFAQTSMRSIASEAGVDVALISHYFGNKRGLFLAVAEFPIDPRTVFANLPDIPPERLGSELLRHLLTIWASPAGPGVIAVFRSSLTGDEELLRQVITSMIMPEVRARLAATVTDVDQRLPLAASQIAGVMVMRHLLRIEPLASMAIDDVVHAIGPNVDRLLTGEVDLPHA